MRTLQPRWNDDRDRSEVMIAERTRLLSCLVRGSKHPGWPLPFRMLSAKVVLADLVEQLATADAKAFRGLGAVAAQASKALSIAPLDISKQGA